MSMIPEILLLFFTLSLGIPVSQHVANQKSIEVKGPCDSAPCISILDTGSPDEDLASGGIVWTNQSLGIRFRFLDVFPNGSLLSITTVLSTSRININSKKNTVTFSLCRENPILIAPDSARCICNASFDLVATHRVRLTWSPMQNIVLHKGQFYWFVVRGDGDTEESSFTWLDGNNKLAPSSDALIMSSHSTDGINWIVDSKADGKTELPTTLVLVRR
jgi:hypothetical protein